MTSVQLRYRIFTFLFSALVVLCASVVSAQEAPVDYSGYVGTDYVCEIQALAPSDSTPTQLNVQSLLNCLEKIVPQNRVSELKSRWKSPWIDQSAIASSGIRVNVDRNEFKVLFYPSNEDVLPKLISVQNQNSLDLKPTVAESPWLSGYLNYSASGIATYSDAMNTGANSELEFSEQFALNPVVSLGGTVFESYHRTTVNNPRLQRLETFSITDFEKSFSRLRIGDSFSPTTSLIEQFRLVGVSLNRNYLYSENFINRPLGEREIYLERPAKVDVYVNFVLVASLSLQAGRHLLNDIPTNQGINSVVLRITEAGGTVRSVVFQTAVEDSLFRKGYSDYSFNLGRLNEGLTETPTYSDDIVGSALYRYGVTNQFTLGSSLAFRKSLGIVGWDGTLASNKGIFKLEFAASKNEDATGSGVRLSYSWICNCSVVGKDQRFNLGIETYSRGFVRQISNIAVSTLPYIRHGFFSSYSQSLNRKSSVRLSATINQPYTSSRVLYNGAVEYNRNISNQFLMSLRYSNSILERVGPSIHEFGLQLIYRFASGLTSATANTNVVSEGPSRSRVGANYSNPLKYETALGEISTDGSDSQVDLQASKGFENIDIGIQSLTSEVNRDFQQRFSLNPSGSIVFGGGHFGLGRYIRDSYIVFLNDTDRTIFLNGDEQNYEAKVKSGRASVITNTQSYRTKTIAVTSSGENIYDVQESLLRLKPRYKSALIYEQKQAYNVWLTGKLVDKVGENIGMTAGQLRCGSEEPVAFFTDTDGTFLVQTAGQACRLTVDSRPFEIGFIVETVLKDGVTKLGQVRLQTKTNND